MARHLSVNNLAKNQFQKNNCSRQELLLAKATRGIAATLFLNGRTLTSQLKAPIATTEHSTRSITPRSATAELLRKCKLLVVDEATMANKHFFEGINRNLQGIRKDDWHFGGVDNGLVWRLETDLTSGEKGWTNRHRQCLPQIFTHWKARKKKLTTRNMRMALPGTWARGTWQTICCRYVGEGRVAADKQIGDHKIKCRTTWPIIDLPIWKTSANLLTTTCRKNHHDTQRLCATNHSVEKKLTFTR